MKIALICTEKLPVPPILGGAIQIYIDAILKTLAKYHQITLFSLENSKLPVRYEKENIRYIRIKGKTPDEYINNIKKELTDEFDLIHVYNRPLWVLRLSDAAPQSAFSLSLHNEMFAPKKIDPERAKICIERVSFINTVSQFIADGVKKLYPSAESKLKVIYSAADLNDFQPIWSPKIQEERVKMRQEFGIDQKKVVLFVGRLCKKKGAHVLLRAMEKVMLSHPEAALMFVGSKWYGRNITDEFISNLQAKAKELRGPVIFTGFLASAEIAKYYHLGDIFVCASQWREPLARIHYEAMAAGLPIITTARGGNPEVIKNEVNGLVLEDYANPQIMAEKISYLLRNPEIALQLGKTGRKYAEMKYYWQRVADELLSLFNTVKVN